MPRFVVEINFPADEYLDSLERMAEHNPDFLPCMFWGEMEGETKGWVVVDADDAAMVANLFPPNLRDWTKIAEVDQFTVDDVREIRHRAA